MSAIALTQRMARFCTGEAQDVLQLQLYLIP